MSWTGGNGFIESYYIKIKINPWLGENPIKKYK
jgi:hypothetical protein